MDALIKMLAALAVTGLLGLKIWLQHNDLVTEQEKNISLSQGVVDRDATIKQLQDAEADNKKRLARLQSETRRITATLTEREIFIESMQHDDPHIQSWADTALPDVIVRLRRHDAATGAGDYHPELPEREPVFSTGSVSEN